jgi:hypothetical protein
VSIVCPHPRRHLNSQRHESIDGSFMSSVNIINIPSSITSTSKHIVAKGVLMQGGPLEESLVLGFLFLTSCRWRFGSLGLLHHQFPQG